MNTWAPHYRLVPGSAGSAFAPPGHPTHRYTLEGYETTRKRNPFSIGSIEYALADDFDGSEYIKDRVRRIFDDAQITESELWVRSVYAHWHNCYLPDGATEITAADKLVIHNPVEIAHTQAWHVLRDHYAPLHKPGEDLTAEGRNADNYRRGVTPLYGRRRGYEITAAPDATKIYIYALADDGTRYSADHLSDHAQALAASDAYTDVHIQPAEGDRTTDRVVATLTNPPQPLDPERHAAAAYIRKYFPDHQVRHDLITTPPKGAGKCTRCGEQVQYEGKYDKLAKVSTRMTGSGITQWSYNTDCTDGADHTLD